MAIEESFVFIIDHDESSRLSIYSLIQTLGLKTKSFRHPKEFLESYEQDWMGCIISDIRMPEMGGLELQQELAVKEIELPIIFVTAHGDIPAAVSAMKSGAFDFLEKPFRPQYLLERVQQAIRYNQRYLAKRRIDSLILKRFELLTERELEVMRSVVAGKPNKVIAQEMMLSQKTVEFHRCHVMAKMGAKSVADLVRFEMISMQARRYPRFTQGNSAWSMQGVSSIQ